MSWGEDDEPLGGDTDAVTAPDELVRWARRLGVLTTDPAPSVDARELHAALALRRAIYVTFAALARGDAPPRDALAQLERTHAAAVAAAQLVGRDGAWALDWPAGDPRRVRFAVCTDAVALLGDERRVARVRRCPGRDCGWLFLDTSGRRRWCSMSTCGSREKMRRMYERRRAPD